MPQWRWPLKFLRDHPAFRIHHYPVPGTLELVAHENYIVILIEDATAVTAINIVHARQRWPT
jgi:hypothetical protein